MLSLCSSFSGYIRTGLVSLCRCLINARHTRLASSLRVEVVASYVDADPAAFSLGVAASSSSPIW
jgi:hypothetical protein